MLQVENIAKTKDNNIAFFMILKFYFCLDILDTANLK